MTQTTSVPERSASGRGGFAGAALAWLIIAACVIYSFWQTNWPFEWGVAGAHTPASMPASTSPAEPSGTAASDATKPDDAYANAARIMLALSDMVAGDDASTRAWFLSEAAPLPNAGPGDHLVHVIMAADLVGRGEAITQLDLLEEKDALRMDALSSADQELRATIRRLYASPADAASPISDADRLRLEEDLGWFGRFAPLAGDRGSAGAAERSRMLAQAKTAPLIIAGAGVWFVLAMVIGLVMLVMLLVKSMRGTLRHGLILAGGASGPYVEGFAAFAVVFTGVQVLRDAAPSAFESLSPAFAISVSIGMQVVGLLAALLWTCWRVGSWRTVRAEAGLHGGRGVIRETLVGLLGYCTAIPLLLLGVALMFVLLAVQKLIWPDAPMPSHPAQEMLKTSDWLTTAQIFLLGVVVAPIVEETVFRGLLYQHLRSVSRGWGIVMSMLFSMAISSLAFAAIHPQSWPAVPALALLASSFCISREWRGSLIPCIVAHGVSNGVMLTVGMTLFRG